MLCLAEAIYSLVLNVSLFGCIDPTLFIKSFSVEEWAYFWKKMPKNRGDIYCFLHPTLNIKNSSCFQNVSHVWLIHAMDFDPSLG